MSAEKSLEYLVGQNGVEILKKSQKGIDAAIVVQSSLDVAKAVQLNHLFKNCSKIQCKLPFGDTSVEISKSDKEHNLWTGNVSYKNSKFEVKGISGENLCAITLAMNKSDNFQTALVQNKGFVELVEKLTQRYTAPAPYIISEQSNFACEVCKSAMTFTVNKVELCPCLAPLQASDVTVTKSAHEKNKIEFGSNWKPSQVKDVLKIITKSLLKRSA
jgi:hypothetical protein